MSVLCVCVGRCSGGSIHHTPGADRLSVKLCSLIQIQPPMLLWRTSWQLVLSSPLLSSCFFSSPLLSSRFLSSPLSSGVPSLAADYRAVIPCMWQAGWLAWACVCACFLHANASVFTHLCGHLCTYRSECECPSLTLIMTGVWAIAVALLEDSKEEWNEALVLRRATAGNGIVNKHMHCLV